MLLKIFRFLDKHHFLRYRLWEFGFLNSARYFPLYFLFRIILAHPVNSLEGSLFYRNLVKRNLHSNLYGTISLDLLLKKLKQNPDYGTELLIALGFCLKPYDNNSQKSLCPVGFANHQCNLLDKINLNNSEKQQWPSVCSSCTIGKLALASEHLGTKFYIMTSALDIARDVYLPAIKSNNPQYGIFTLCNYSVEPFTFGLSIAGLNGAIINFCSGDCQDHTEWTKADVGVKTEQTELNSSELARLLFDLKTISKNNPPVKSYCQQGNVYHPQFDIN